MRPIVDLVATLGTTVPPGIARKLTGAVLQDLPPWEVVTIVLRLADPRREVWERTLDWIEDALPLWWRIQVRHARIGDAATLSPAHTAWLEKQLAAEQSYASWRALETLSQMLKFSLLDEALVGPVLRAVEEGWRQADPLSASVFEQALVDRGAALFDHLMPMVQSHLTSLPLGFRLVTAGQIIFDMVSWSCMRTRAPRFAPFILLFPEARECVEEILARMRAQQSRSVENCRVNTVAADVAELYRRGHQCLEDHSPVEGVRYLEEAVDRQPDCLPALLRLVDHYTLLNKPKRVNLLLDQARLEVGDHYEILRRLVAYYELTEDTENALALEKQLAAMTIEDPASHMRHLRSAVHQAVEAKQFIEAGELAMSFMRRYGGEDKVLDDFATSYSVRHGDSEANDHENDNLAIASQVIERCTEHPLRRIGLFQKVGAHKRASMDLYRFLRASNEQDSPAWLAGAAVQGDVDRRVLGLAAALAKGELTGALATHGELLEIVPDRTDLQFFGAVIHKRLAEHYWKRGMSDHTAQHIRRAEQYYQRMLWSEYWGQEVFQLSASMAVLRLLLSPGPVTLDDIRTAQEIVRASLLGEPLDLNASELDANLEVASLKRVSDTYDLRDLAAGAADVWTRLKQISRFVDQRQLDSSFAYRTQFSLIDSIAGFLESTAGRTGAEAVLEFLSQWGEDLRSSAPTSIRGWLYRGETLLRLADALISCGDHAEHHETLLSARKALRSVEHGTDAAAVSEALASDEQIRLGVRIQQVEGRLLEVASRSSAQGLSG